MEAKKKQHGLRSIYCKCLTPTDKIVGCPDRQLASTTAVGSEEELVMPRWCSKCKSVNYYSIVREYIKALRRFTEWTSPTPVGREAYESLTTPVVARGSGIEVVSEWSRKQALGVWPFGILMCQ